MALGDVPLERVAKMIRARAHLSLFFVKTLMPNGTKRTHYELRDEKADTTTKTDRTKGMRAVDSVNQEVLPFADTLPDCEACGGRGAFYDKPTDLMETQECWDCDGTGKVSK